MCIRDSSADVPAASSIHADDAKLHERGGSRGAAFVFPGRLAFGGKSAKSAMENGTVGALALSVSSSVSIVIVNKYLMSTLGFP